MARSFAAMTQDALTRSALVAAAAGSLAAPAAADGFSDFLETFALADDRAAALEALVPGTEVHDYFTCLHLQSQGLLDEADEVLSRWLERFSDRSTSPRYRQIEARQALLRASDDPERTYAFLKRTLGLVHDHQRQVPGAVPDRPVALDPARIDTDRLLRRRLRRDRGDALSGLDERILERLVTLELTENQRAALLEKLPRADVPGLVQLVARDLDSGRRRTFGDRAIHGKLTLRQLDELLASRPALKSSNAFVSAYLKRLAPAFDVSLEDETDRAEYVARVWSFVSTLPASFNSLKASVLHQRLQHDLETGALGAERLRRYLSLPRDRSYAPKRIREDRRHRVDFDRTFDDLAWSGRIGDDTPLVNEYLSALLADARDYDAFLDVVEESFLRRVFARTKLLGGAAGSDEFARWLGGPAAVESLRDEVHLTFARSCGETWGADESVALDVHVKNVDELIVKVFELDPVAVFDRFRDLDVVGLDLDGLVPTDERVLGFGEAPILRHTETIELEACAGPGLYVVELIGGGLTSRAVLEKGSLHLVERIGAAGHMFRVLDAERRPVEGAVLRFGGRDFEAGEAGEILVPYTEDPGRKSLLVRAGGVASLRRFQHLGERYALDAAVHATTESLLAGAEARIAVRPRLTLNGQPVDAGLLDDPRLVVTSTDRSGATASKTVQDLDLSEPGVIGATVRIPDRCVSFAVTFEGTVRSLVGGEDVPVAAEATAIRVGTIADGSPHQTLLHRDVRGYRLEVRGRNGEPVVDRVLKVALRNPLVAETVEVSLKTDARGRVELGALEDIESVRVLTPSELAGSWPVQRPQYFGMLDVVHARVGLPVHVPYVGRATRADRGAFSLIEMRGGAPYRDVFSAVEVSDGYAVLRGLDAGEYRLRIKDTDDDLTVLVVDGPTRSGHHVGAHTVLQATDPLPLQIRTVARTDEGLVVMLGGAGPDARVHVSATHFVDPQDAAYDLAFDPRGGVARTGLDAARASYRSERRISDEYRYILARRRQEPWFGNMLERPGVLLNPWVVNDTTDGMLADGFRSALGAGGGGGSKSAGRFGGKKRRAGGGAATPQQLLDFLGEPAALLTNLVPDEEGRVVIPFAALGTKHRIQVVATDGRFTAAVDVTGESSAPALRDRRLVDALRPDAPMLQRRRIVFTRPGEALRIRDGLSARTKTYDTLSDVFEYFVSSGDAELVQFEFLTRWPSLDDDEKRAKYSEFVCHELNAFLRVKDPAFFEAVVRPYMANKAHRTFMDDWLLGAELSAYLEPARFARLNDVEKILLLGALDGDAAQLAGDLMALVPRGAFSLDDAWSQVLSIGGLDEAGALEGAIAERRARGRGPAAPAPASRAGETLSLGRSVSSVGSARDELHALGYAGAPVLLDAEEAELGLADAPFAAAADDAGRTAGEFRRDNALRKQSEGFFFRDLAATEAYAETHYWRVRLGDTDGDLVTISPFWADFARSGATAFVSTEFPLANRSTTERLLALAFLDLPFESGEHAVKLDGRAVTMVAGSPLLVALEDVVAPGSTDEASTLLVGQDFFRVDRRYEVEDGVQRERYVTGEFLTGVPYGYRVVATNPSSSSVRVGALLQIPEGAIPLGDTMVTDGRPLELGPYGTQSLEGAFYFPAPGAFDAFGVHVGRGDELVAKAPAARIAAVDELSEVDTQAWEWISQNGSLQDVLAFLDVENPHQIALDQVAWRVSEPDAFRAITARLERRNVYDPTLWSYAIVHRDDRRTAEFLAGNSAIRRRVGYAFRSDLLTVVPEESGAYEHLAYEPLVVGRVLPFGDQSRIQNADFGAQYGRFLEKVALQPALLPSDELELCYYLLLQERVPEAIERFARVDRDSVRSGIQHDYMRAYLAFSRGEADEAAEIATAYVDHPVERWRGRFRNVLAQYEEIAGRGNPDAVDPDDRDQTQGALAGAEPILDVAVEAGLVRVASARIDAVEVRYHAMDIEFLFSSSPFVEGDRGAFGLVRPNRIDVVPVPEGADGVEVEVPAEFTGRNVLVEVRGGGLSRRASYFAGSVGVQGIERYGQVRVVDSSTKAPLPRTYVKVYARLADGTVRFHKDGYTDLRGRFDYVSLSGVEGPEPTRYAVLALHEDRGATVSELAPPAR